MLIIPHAQRAVYPLTANVPPHPSFCRLSTLLHSSPMSSCSSYWYEVPPWRVLWMALNTTLGKSPTSPSWWRQRWDIAWGLEAWQTSVVIWACHLWSNLLIYFIFLIQSNDSSLPALVPYPQQGSDFSSSIRSSSSRSSYTWSKK